jgi:hypothetical protein
VSQTGMRSMGYVIRTIDSAAMPAPECTNSRHATSA